MMLRYPNIYTNIWLSYIMLVSWYTDSYSKRGNLKKRFISFYMRIINNYFIIFIYDKNVTCI